MEQLVHNIGKMVEWSEEKKGFIFNTKLIKRIAKEKMSEYMGRVEEKNIKIGIMLLYGEVMCWIIDVLGKYYYEIKTTGESERVINKLNSFISNKISENLDKVAEEIIEAIAKRIEEDEKGIKRCYNFTWKGEIDWE
jgi:hypothetical protein